MSGEGLTPEGFEALLKFLDPDDREHAGELYETSRRRLVRLFRWRGVGIPEDLADETINRAARRIAEGVKVTEPYSYFCGIAYRVYQEVLRREKKEKPPDVDEWPPRPPDEEEDVDERLECLRRCLDRLPEDQRILVLRYHQDEDHIRSRQELSRDLGIPMNALRIRVHRVRKKLEDCVRDCLRECR